MPNFVQLWTGSDEIHIIELPEHYRPSVRVGLQKQNWIKRNKDQYAKIKEHLHAI